MSTTLLRQDEVDKIRDWANQTYGLSTDKQWNKRVPRTQILEQMKEKVALREEKKENGKQSKMSKQVVEQRFSFVGEELESAVRFEKENLRNAECNDDLILDNVLRYVNTHTHTHTHPSPTLSVGITARSPQRVSTSSSCARGIRQPPTRSGCGCTSRSSSFSLSSSWTPSVSAPASG